MSLAGELNDVDSTAAETGAESAAEVLESTFPRTRRLLNPAQFSSVLAAPIAVRAGAFALHVVSRAAADTAQSWRLGLVIPKRFVASAARRNAIKRRWREAFRLRVASLDAQFAASDLVVRLTARLSASKQPMPKQPAATVAKRRQVQQGSAIQFIDANLMIDQMVARLSSRALAKPDIPSRPPR